MISHLHLVVVLEDVSGCSEVQHSVEDQLTVASQLVALPLEKGDLHLFLTLDYRGEPESENGDKRRWCSTRSIGTLRNVNRTSREKALRC